MTTAMTTILATPMTAGRDHDDVREHLLALLEREGAYYYRLGGRGDANRSTTAETKEDQKSEQLKIRNAEAASHAVAGMGNVLLDDDGKGGKNNGGGSRGVSLDATDRPRDWKVDSETRREIAEWGYDGAFRCCFRNKTGRSLSGAFSCFFSVSPSLAPSCSLSSL